MRRAGSCLWLLKCDNLPSVSLLHPSKQTGNLTCLHIGRVTTLKQTDNSPERTLGQQKLHLPALPEWLLPHAAG